jgi:hypothetical protein
MRPVIATTKKSQVVIVPGEKRTGLDHEPAQQNQQERGESENARRADAPSR